MNLMTRFPFAALALSAAWWAAAQTFAADERCGKCGNARDQCSGCTGGKHDDCKCKMFAADKGPAKIDVSAYPKEMQDTYRKLFSARCSKCHTLARPINTDLSPSKWEEYIKKMSKKPGSGIKGKDAESVWKFLVFDTKTRKKAFWEKLPASEKEAGS